MSDSSFQTTPYKGLHPYQEEDASFFFGRGPDWEIITNNLIAHRLTILYGPSGVGKSSLLRAGVVSHLRQMGEYDSQTYNITPESTVIVFDDWRQDPIELIKASVNNSLEPLSGLNTEI